MINDSILISILSKTATDSEEKAFRAWIESSKENKDLFESYKAIWEKFKLTNKKPQFNKELAKLRIQEAIKAQHRKSNKRSLIIKTTISIAASLALIIGMSLFIPINKNTIKYSASYNTSSEIKKVTLDDSSQVWLNKNSSIYISKNFNHKKREITLKGEAFFDIKRNEEKPFIIKCGDTETKVLGTSFNIKNDSAANKITLSVKSGIVRFKGLKTFIGSEVVKVNEQCCYQIEEKSLLLTKLKNPNFLSWKTGKLQFSHTPINDVCKQLSAHYKTPIIIDTIYSGLQLTGNFNNEPLENILTTIAISMDVKFDTINHEIHLVR